MRGGGQLKTSQFIEQVMNEYAEFLFRIAYYYVKDSQIAEDIVQDVFIKFYYANYEDKGELKAYLSKITANACKDYLKSWSYRKLKFVEKIFAKENVIHNDGLIHQEEMNVLDKAILSLPLKQREAIVYYYLENLSVKKISEMLHCPESTVKSRIKSGKDLLKKKLFKEQWRCFYMNNYRLTPLRNTTENKKRIIDNARNEMYMRQVKSHKRRWLPVLVSIFLVIISLFITAPYINNAFFNKDSYTIEKVVIPNVPYDSLITSTYVEEKNEFIYNTDSGFYVFDVENSEQSMLVSTNGIGRIFDYAVSEKWLVWAQPVNDEDKIHVLNRETLEQKILDIASFRGIRLVQDMIFYLNIGDESKSINYMKFNLLTEKTEVLREFEGDSNSKPAIDGNQIAISENRVIDEQIQTLEVSTISKHLKIRGAILYRMKLRKMFN